MTVPTSQRALDLLNTGRIRDAVALVTNAARRGDGEALYELGQWRVCGYPVPRDFAAARELFKQSAAAGCEAAAHTHAVFVAIGAGGGSNWARALQILTRAAGQHSSADRQISLLRDMKLDGSGYPTQPMISVALSTAPTVSIIRKFMTPSECAHMRMLAKPRLVPSVVVDPVTGRETAHPIRTSDGAVLGPIQMDLVTEALNRRIARATKTPVERGEPLVVLHYTPGQQFRLHHDCLPAESNQREITMIVFLSDEFEGGETFFPAFGTRIKGAIGDAIFFRNILPDGSVDKMSRHAGLPVRSGEKWICTRWIRVDYFDPWRMRGT